MPKRKMIHLIRSTILDLTYYRGYRTLGAMNRLSFGAHREIVPSKDASYTIKAYRWSIEITWDWLPTIRWPFRVELCRDEHHSLNKLRKK